MVLGVFTSRPRFGLSINVLSRTIKMIINAQHVNTQKERKERKWKEEEIWKNGRGQYNSKRKHLMSDSPWRGESFLSASPSQSFFAYKMRFGFFFPFSRFLPSFLLFLWDPTECTAGGGVDFVQRNDLAHHALPSLLHGLSRKSEKFNKNYSLLLLGS